MNARIKPPPPPPGRLIKGTDIPSMPRPLGPAFNWASEAYTHWSRARRIDALLQIGIAALSLAAIALVATDGPAQRYGFVLGLCSQPFWIAATFRARQWGMLFLAVFYCGFWTQGILIRF